MTLRTSLPDMSLLQRNTSGNLSCNASKPDELLLRCKQLHERFLFHVNAKLSKGAYSGSKVYLSSVNGLTLNEFVLLRKLYCKLHHRDTTAEECSRCHPLICLSERISVRVFVNYLQYTVQCFQLFSISQTKLLES